MPREDLTGPHFWTPKGWRFWLCLYCLAPRSMHGRNGARNEWVIARARNDNRYLSADAPHFREGW